MNAEQYFNRMKETNAIVNPFIHEAVSPLKQYSKGLFETVYELPEKRTETSGQARAFFLRNAYECTGGSDWEKIAPICAAVELELCNMYYSNRIYDEKGGEKGLAEISRGIIGGKITRDLSTKLILEQKNNFPPEILIRIADLINEADLVCESGQYLDIFENTYQNMKDASFEQMIGSCMRRAYCINASFYEKIGIMAGLLAKSSENEITTLAEFGRLYGMAQQLTNDVTDFVPSYDFCYSRLTSEKELTDIYRDIMHGKLTLPVIYSLHCENTGLIIWRSLNEPNKPLERLKCALETGMKTPVHDLYRLTVDMIDNGSLDSSIHRARVFGREARKPLRIFPVEKREFLSAMCIVMDSNRFYRHLEKLKSDLIVNRFATL